MPGFTQEPYIEKSKSIKFFKKISLPVIIGLVFFYVIYYFTPTSISSLIPNPLAKKSTIAVLGTGTVTTQPDIAQFAVTVATIDSTSQGALTKAKDKVQDLVIALKAKGLADSDVKISSYNTTFTTTGNALNYVAGTTILVNSPDILLADSLIEIALSRGARLSQPLTYQSNDQANFELLAKDLAINDARKKAKQIAGKLNKRLGKITAYSDTVNNQASSLFTLSDNTIEITQVVEITFQTK